MPQAGKSVARVTAALQAWRPLIAAVGGTGGVGRSMLSVLVFERVDDGRERPSLPGTVLGSTVGKGSSDLGINSSRWSWKSSLSIIATTGRPPLVRSKSKRPQPEYFCFLYYYSLYS